MCAKEAEAARQQSTRSAYVEGKCLSFKCLDVQIYSELGARSKASGDATCAKLQENRSYFTVRTPACASKIEQFVIA